MIRQVCCSRIRRIHSKGAIIVLFWVFLAWTSFFFVGGSADSTGVQFVGNGLLNREGIDLTLLGKDIPLHYVCYATIAIVWVLGTPLAGWLADVRFGRYKVMQVSLWIMWCGILLHSCLYLLHDDDQSISTNGVLLTLESTVSFVSLIVYMCGFVGLLINSVQFGIDQMPDASSAELSAFIHWYVFTTCAGIWFPQAVLGLMASCPTPHPEETLSNRQIIVLAILPTLLLSLGLLLDSYFRHHLIIEPHTMNPFKLVTGVLKYISKNDRPTNPSAYVYTMTTIPNRFDFAKLQYGGPYTTEQVEDVKTLLRIIILMSPTIIILACTTLTAFHLGEFEKHIRKCSNTSECSQTLITFFGYNYWFIAMMFIVISEFLIYPVFVRFHGLCCKALRRIMIGTVLVLALSLVLVALAVAGYVHPQVSCVNTTVTTCNLNIDYLPVVIPINFTLAVQTILFISGAWEFICSQAPYSMRGLLIGAVWASETIGAVFTYFVRIGWYFGTHRHPTSIKNIGCGGFYFISVSFLCFVGLVLYCIAVCWYRPRMREETEDQQRLVEEIYAKEIDAAVTASVSYSDDED